MASERIWLPSDENVPSHLKTQRIHHEKRQRWSAQLLEKLSTTLVRQDHDEKIWSENARSVERTIWAAAIPFGDDRPDKEGRYVKQALCGIHALVRKNHYNNNMMMISNAAIREATLLLVDRAESMSLALPLSHVVEIRWAAQGLLKTFGIQKELANMNVRVERLPFDILPKAIDWKQAMQLAPHESPIDILQDVIPFSFDIIQTRGGTKVTERRGTAWLAEPTIGALAYSGKLMPPRELSPQVRSTMRSVEEAIGMSSNYFDCALCNHYPDSEAACKFHTDPEHGLLWERLTCVVAAGDERKFAFRPIPGSSRWIDWETSTKEQIRPGDENLPASIHLFEGDVVIMYRDCNDLFHHAVYSDENNNEQAGRVSLVLKRAIERGGKRGHSQQGEGRRARRKRNEAASDSATNRKNT